MSTNSSAPGLQGWTSSPDGRGTLDIIWTSVATIFVSTWSAICLNVPEPTDTMWTMLRRKVWITFIALMGPEFLLGYAIGEWQSARTSFVAFRSIRQDDRWTRRHAFFADMGGFVLRTKDGVQFFLDAAHILWLVRHKAVSKEQFERCFLLDLKVIEDRNKSDRFIRILAVAQIIWFCVNMIARAIQGLAVTTLEVTVVGIVVNSVLVYYFWKDKPADVQQFDIVDVDLTIDELLLLEEDGEARTRTYFRTPLDFTSRTTWWTQLVYTYMMNMLKSILHWPWTSHSKKSAAEHSLGRRSDNDVLPVTGLRMVLCSVFTCVFLGTNFIAWNFHFPTATERLIWRIASCGMIGGCIAGIIVAELWYDQQGIKRMQESVQRRRKAVEQGPKRSTSGISTWQDVLLHRMRRVAVKISNNSAEADHALDVAPTFIIPIVLGFFFYFLGRMYFLIEDFIAFRRCQQAPTRRWTGGSLCRTLGR